jgi:hypothetical protein
MKYINIYRNNWGKWGKIATKITKSSYKGTYKRYFIKKVAKSPHLPHFLGSIYIKKIDLNKCIYYIIANG